MQRWSWSDRIGILNLVIAVIGFLVILLQALPSVLPEVILLVDIEEFDYRDFSTATTTFQNASYTVPISSLKASWRIQGEDVRADVEEGAPQYSLEDLGGVRVLEVKESLPARLSFKTVFNSAKPFRIFDFDAEATVVVSTAAGEYRSEVPVMRTKHYKTLVSVQYLKIGGILVAWLLGYAMLLYLTKRFLPASMNKEPHHV